MIIIGKTKFTTSKINFFFQELETHKVLIVSYTKVTKWLSCLMTIVYKLIKVDTSVLNEMN